MRHEYVIERYGGSLFRMAYDPSKSTYYGRHEVDVARFDADGYYRADLSGLWTYPLSVDLPALLEDAGAVLCSIDGHIVADRKVKE